MDCEAPLNTEQEDPQTKKGHLVPLRWFCVVLLCSAALKNRNICISTDQFTDSLLLSFGLRLAFNVKFVGIKY